MTTLTNNKMNYPEQFMDIFHHLLSKKNLQISSSLASRAFSMASKVDIYYQPTLSLAVGQYLIILEQSKYKTGLVDSYIDKYRDWIGESKPDSMFMCKELQTTRTHMNESYKLRVLNTAYINKLKEEGVVTDNLKDANNRETIMLRLMDLYYQILRNSKYKSTIKYIEQLPKLNEETFGQYVQYIMKSDTNFMISKLYDYNMFVYNLLFTFIGQFKANKIVEDCHEFICNVDFSYQPEEYEVEDFKHDVNVLMTLNSLRELMEFNSIVKGIHNGLGMVLNQKKYLCEFVKKELCDDDDVEGIFTKNKLIYKYDVIRKRTIFMLESLINEKYLTSSEIDKLSADSKYKHYMKKIGFEYGKINAFVLLDKLGSIMDMNYKYFYDFKSDAPFADTDYAMSQIMLSYFDLDIMYTLNDITLTIEELEAFTDMFSLMHDFKSTWFTLNLSLVDKRIADTQLDVSHLYDYDQYDEFEDDKISIINALIQFCLYKHMKQSAEVQFDAAKSTFTSSFTDNTSVEEIQHLREVNDKQLNEISELKQQLRQAQLSLHNKDLAHANEIQSYKEQVREMKEQLEMDKELDMAEIESEGITIRELADQENDDVSVDQSDKDYIELIKELNVAVIGGHNNLHTNIRNAFPNKNLTLIAPRNYTTPIKVISKADVIVYIDSHNNHGQFRRVMGQLRKTDSKYKMFYSNTQPQPKVLAKAIYEHYKCVVNK